LACVMVMVCPSYVIGCVGVIPSVARSPSPQTAR
jgi:hypothetical protein